MLMSRLPDRLQPLDPAGIALFLDLDGTLAAIAMRPELARVPPDIVTLVHELHRRTAGATAIVSGRSLADIERMMTPLRLPAAGQHGAERRRADGTVTRVVADMTALAAMRVQLFGLIVRHPRLLLEQKSSALALHYREAPDLVEACGDAVRDAIRPHAAGFEVLAGKMVLEIKPRGSDKGAAIRAFMAEPPFSGRQPVFAGDDVTDECGFEAVNALAGVSIKIGEGETAACTRLPEIGGLIAWLDALKRKP
jgi:trehalose 6-phosphate phosphatase